MEYIATFIDIVLHLDKHLALLVQQYEPGLRHPFRHYFQRDGVCGYAFFAWRFLALCCRCAGALGGMDIGVLLVVLVSAAALGNMLNYQGWSDFLGPKVFHWENSRF